jgi:ADP-ribosylglycohydrolase
MSSSFSSLDRYQGCLAGLAVGDAVGTTLEFSPPNSFTPITDMVGGGPFHLLPGQWTDDTSMALCLAESLLECQGFDPHDQLRRYVRWYRHGHLSSTGALFDIGNTIRLALQRFERSGEPYCGSDDPWTASNGALMRLAPAAMAFARQPLLAIQRCDESARTTHQARPAVDACRYLGALLVAALHGVDKEALLAEPYSPLAGYWEVHPLHPDIQAVALGSYKRRQPPAISGKAYAATTLEAALWAFYRSDSFREGCLLATNLGEDADTTGAVYGQLAGAFYGLVGIPDAWLDCLCMRQLILEDASRLLALAQILGTPAGGNVEIAS